MNTETSQKYPRECKHIMVYNCLLVSSLQSKDAIINVNTECLKQGTIYW